MPTTSVSTSASNFQTSSYHQPSSHSSSSFESHSDQPPSATAKSTPDEFLPMETTVVPLEFYDSANIATVRPRHVVSTIPTSSPIDIFDIEPPDPPPRPIISVRHSNQVRSCPISPSSSRRPSVRQRVTSHVPLPPPDAVSSTPSTIAHDYLAPPMQDTAQSPPGPDVPSTSVPLVADDVSPPIAGPAVPPCPSPTVPPCAIPPASQTAAPSISAPSRDALVDILHTLADNQHFYFQYAISRDQITQYLLC